MIALPPRAVALAGLLLACPAPGVADGEDWPVLAAMPPRPAAMASAEEMARLAERLAALGEQARKRGALLRAGGDISDDASDDGGP